MASIRKTEEGDGSNFKVVPASLAEITPDWCNIVLKKELFLSTDTFVSSVNIKPLENEINGMSDGGGFSGSALVRISLKYCGNVSGKEPSSLVCKLSLGTGYKLSFIWRMMLYASAREGYDEYMYKQEAKFLEHVLPIMESTLYKFPKLYYCGIKDQGARGFATSVILNMPTKVKTVVLMEDMKDWRSSSVGIPVSNQDANLCFRNVSILHAKFWGENLKDIKSRFKPSKTERDFRPASYTKFHSILNKINFSTDRIKKYISKARDSDWKTDPMTSLKKDSPLIPHWLTVQPLEDGTLPIFEDDLVLEMLNELAVKAPNYYTKKLKSFFKKPPQTILHGDFHAGNHMYGTHEHIGKIVALDYQWAGPGRVATEFVYFFMQSLSPHSLEDIMDISKSYHTELLVNGVNDYSWEEFVDDITMTITGMSVSLLSLFPSLSPTNLLEFADGMGNNGEAAKKIFANCMYGKYFLFLTSLYVNYKEGFLS
jgi:hypothetical protein